MTHDRRTPAQAILAAPLLAALLAACVGAIAPSAGVPSPSAAPATGSTATVAPTWPVPADGVLLRLDRCPVGCADPRGLELLADGRVLRRDEAGRLLSRRLSGAGFDRVAARITQGADLLGADLHADPTLAPDATPPPYAGFDRIAFTSRLTGTEVRVIAVDPAGLASGGAWRPTPTMERLASLARDLAAIETLAAGGWAEPAWSDWEPGIRILFLAARPAAAPFPTPDLGTESLFDGDLGEIAAPVGSPLDAWPETRCAVIGQDTMETLLGGLPTGLVAPAAERPAFLRLIVGDAARSRILMILPVVPLPDEVAGGCAGAPLAWVW